MSKLAQLKSKDADFDKINAWLNKIGEQDQSCRDELINQCKKDIEAREFYVKKYMETLE